MWGLQSGKAAQRHTGVPYRKCKTLPQGEKAAAVLWRRGAFQSEKYRERLAKSYPFLYFKKKMAFTSWGGQMHYKNRFREAKPHDHAMATSFKANA
ncbi:hypothetical protein BBD42_18705 [Paenibacillus sp. BIHB 4019]|uniref:Uncharacterized protein n=1 Tax=Paenibacillus sp. BIHB 4019 TaxID=1870819 RepID=A0A1B2DKP8_9BACL|nr:hypothetical protein BBD42_18705 [Paenibacillus sp. BIHB 4019]